MKIEFDPQDIEIIAHRVAEYLKPLLADNRGNSPPEDELLSVDEAAAFLKTTKGQIYQWVSNAQYGPGGFPFRIAAWQLRHSVSATV